MQDIKFRIITGSINEYGNCTPMGYNELVIGSVDYSVIPILVDEHIVSHNLVPIFMAYTLEVKKPLKRGDIVIGRQIATKVEGVVWSWTFTFTKDEEVAVIAKVYMGLCDQNTHKLCLDIKPFIFDEHPENSLLLESRSREPFVLGEEQMETIPVRKSFIDALGHTNQKHYLEFCYDNMTAEHQKMDNFQRVEVYYLGELVAGNSVAIYRTTQEKQDAFTGIRNDGKPSFSITFHFA